MQEKSDKLLHAAESGDSRTFFSILKSYGNWKPRASTYLNTSKGRRAITKNEIAQEHRRYFNDLMVGTPMPFADLIEYDRAKHALEINVLSEVPRDIRKIQSFVQFVQRLLQVSARIAVTCHVPDTGGIDFRGHCKIRKITQAMLEANLRNELRESKTRNSMK